MTGAMRARTVKGVDERSRVAVMLKEDIGG
jgi:hypothetical protein